MRRERIFYVPFEYLQSGEPEAGLMDMAKDNGFGPDAFLSAAKLMDCAFGIIEAGVRLEPCRDEGDVLLAENGRYAVVLNGMAGDTYELLRKESEDEVRRYVRRFGLSDRASDCLKELARKMEGENQAND